MNPVILKKVNPEQWQTLREVCIKIYPIYFGSYWLGPGLSLYVEEQYGIGRLKKDLKDQTIDYYFILLKEEIVGFLKINCGVDTNLGPKRTTCELEKMYISPDHKNKGIGRKALHQAIRNVRNKGMNLAFLGVLDSNPEARKFYESIGFKWHSKTHLSYKYFKPELSGLDIMTLDLSKSSQHK